MSDIKSLLQEKGRNTQTKMISSNLLILFFCSLCVFLFPTMTYARPKVCRPGKEAKCASWACKNIAKTSYRMNQISRQTYKQHKRQCRANVLSITDLYALRLAYSDVITTKYICSLTFEISLPGGAIAKSQLEEFCNKPADELFYLDGYMGVGYAEANERVEVARRTFQRIIDREQTSAANEYGLVHYPDRNSLLSNYRFCMLVQQCPCPGVLRRIDYMQKDSIVDLWEALFLILPQSYVNKLQLQILGNLFLQNYNDWAQTCRTNNAGVGQGLGKCYRPKSGAPTTPEGAVYLPPTSPLDLSTFLTEISNITSFNDCYNKTINQHANVSLWICDECANPNAQNTTQNTTDPFGNQNPNACPQLILQGDVNTSATSRDTFQMAGNLAEENIVHARGRNAEFFGIFGDVSSGNDFAIRFAGHHFDVVVEIDGTTNKIDVPLVFFGHNPTLISEAPQRTISNVNQVDPFPYTQWFSSSGETLWDITLYTMFQTLESLGRDPAITQTSQYKGLSALKFLDSFTRLGSFIPKSANVTKNATDTANFGSVIPESIQEFTETYGVPVSSLTDETQLDLFALLQSVTIDPTFAQSTGIETYFTEDSKLVYFCGIDGRCPTTQQELEDGTTLVYIIIKSPTYYTFFLVSGQFEYRTVNDITQHIHFLTIPVEYLSQNTSYLMGKIPPNGEDSYRKDPEIDNCPYPYGMPSSSLPPKHF